MYAALLTDARSLVILSSLVKPILVTASLSPWLYTIPFIAIGLISLYFLRSRQVGPINEADDFPGDERKDLKEVIEFSRYAGGHPKIDQLIRPCLIYYESDTLHICKYLDSNRVNVEKIARIPKESILEIRVEDTFNLMKRMTTERWKEAKGHFTGFEKIRDEDIAFLVIDWQRDIDRQLTYFTIESLGNAMELAVKKRNALVRICKPAVLQLV